MSIADRTTRLAALASLALLAAPAAAQQRVAPARPAAPKTREVAVSIAITFPAGDPVQHHFRLVVAAEDGSPVERLDDAGTASSAGRLAAAVDLREAPVRRPGAGVRPLVYGDLTAAEARAALDALAGPDDATTRLPGPVAMLVPDEAGGTRAESVDSLPVDSAASATSATLASRAAAPANDASKAPPRPGATPAARPTVLFVRNMPAPGTRDVHVVLERRYRVVAGTRALRVTVADGGARQWSTVATIGATPATAAVVPPTTTTATPFAVRQLPGRVGDVPPGLSRATDVAPLLSAAVRASLERAPGAPAADARSAPGGDPMLAAEVRRHGVTALALDLPRTAEVRVRITDLRGRVLRDATLAGDAGRWVYRWDGRDAAGRAQPPGVYLVFTTAYGVTVASKLVRVADEP